MTRLALRKRQVLMSSIIILDKLNLIRDKLHAKYDGLSYLEKRDLFLLLAYLTKVLIKLVKIYRILLNFRLVLEWFVAINPYDQPWEVLRLYTQPIYDLARFLIPTKSGTIFGIDFTSLLVYQLLMYSERKLYFTQKQLLYKAVLVEFSNLRKRR